MKKIGKFILLVFCFILIGIVAFGLSYKISTSNAKKQEETNEVQNENTSQSSGQSSSKTNNESDKELKDSEEEEDIKLKPGEYTVNEVKTDDVGVSNEECGVKLQENKYFEIYMGWGSWHSGKYEIQGNTLTCSSTAFEWESGGYGKEDTDVVFTFEIIDENTLKLTDIQINDQDNENLIYEDGLEIGMTYSQK